jgi:hypothetical protein
MTTSQLGRSMRFAAAIAAIAIVAACGTKDPVVSPPTNAEATRSTAPATPQVTAIGAPDSLGGRPKITDADHNKLVADTEAAIKAASPRATSVFVAYYGTPDASKDKIYMFGATMASDVSSKDFEASVDDIAQVGGGAAMEEIQSPDQGALGGKAKCGQVTVNGLLTGICGWYVKNFMVFVMWYAHSAKELVAQLPSIRDEVETRS